MLNFCVMIDFADEVEILDGKFLIKSRMNSFMFY